MLIDLIELINPDLYERSYLSYQSYQAFHEKGFSAVNSVFPLFLQEESLESKLSMNSRS